MPRLGEDSVQRNQACRARRRCSTLIHRTPGTRITFYDVRSWMDGYLRIHRRPPATQRHVQLRGHVAMLTRELIAQERAKAVLEGLRALFQDPRMGLKPPRGARQGTAYELAVTAVHDQLAALARASFGAAGSAPTRGASEARRCAREPRFVGGAAPQSSAVLAAGAGAPQAR